MWEAEGWRPQCPGGPGSLWTLSTFRRQPFRPSICAAFRGIDRPPTPCGSVGSWWEARRSSRSSSRAGRRGTHLRAVTWWTSELSKQEMDLRWLFWAGWPRVRGNQPVAWGALFSGSERLGWECAPSHMLGAFRWSKRLPPLASWSEQLGWMILPKDKLSCLRQRGPEQLGWMILPKDQLSCLRQRGPEQLGWMILPKDQLSCLRQRGPEQLGWLILPKDQRSCLRQRGPEQLGWMILPKDQLSCLRQRGPGPELGSMHSASPLTAGRSQASHLASLCLCFSLLKMEITIVETECNSRLNKSPLYLSRT